jgi:hypothetical protein
VIEQERAIAYLHDCFFGEQCVIDDTNDDDEDGILEAETIHTIDVPEKILINATTTSKLVFDQEVNNATTSNEHVVANPST